MHVHQGRKPAVNVGGTESALSAEKFFAPSQKKIWEGRCSKMLRAIPRTSAHSVRLTYRDYIVPNDLNIIVGGYR